MNAREVDQKILGYLGRALSLELSAVQLYSTQSRLTANWGLGKAADKFQAEAHEELQHAERIIARILAKGFAPNASQLRPVELGPDLLALLKVDQAFETELVKLYHDAAAFCLHQQRDDDRVFFHELMEEEQQHAAELNDWIKSLESSRAGSGR